MSTVYLARAIDARADVDNLDEIERVVCNHLVELGHVVYRPAQAWQVPVVPMSDHALALHEVNETARKGADLVVAIVTPGMRSIGVPAEVGASLAEGKLVAFINANKADALQSSYVLAAWFNTCPTVSLYEVDAAQLRAFLGKFAS